MVCIYCGSKTDITNSRLQKRLNRTWRRRQCLACRAIVTTSEHIDLEKTILVSRQRHVEPFNRDILFVSIHDSLKHRKTAVTDATGLTDTVISALYPEMTDAQVETSTISKVTLQILKRFDRVAFTHYGAFYS